VATDGHRLSLAEAEMTAAGEKRSEIVPRKGVMELNRILEDIDQPLKIMLGQGFLRVDRDHIVMTTKLIDGKFPEYEAVIPFKSEQPMMVNREALIHALQRVAILSNEKYRGVRMELQPDALRIAAHNPQQEEASEELSAEHSHDGLKVGFNVNYLLDALGSVSCETVAISLKDSNSSCLITDPDSDSVRQVIMPLKL